MPNEWGCCLHVLHLSPNASAALRPELRKDAEHTPPPVTTRDSNLSPVQGDGLAWTVRDWVASEACSLLSVVARADKAAAQLNLKTSVRSCPSMWVYSASQLWTDSKGPQKLLTACNIADWYCLRRQYVWLRRLACKLPQAHAAWREGTAAGEACICGLSPVDLTSTCKSLRKKQLVQFSTGHGACTTAAYASHCGFAISFKLKRWFRRVLAVCDRRWPCGRLLCAPAALQALEVLCRPEAAPASTRATHRGGNRALHYGLNRAAWPAGSDETCSSPCGCLDAGGVRRTGSDHLAGAPPRETGLT